MKNYKLLIVLLLFSIPCTSRGELYRIYFNDKGDQILEYNNALYNEILDNLDKKAIQRRKLNSNSENILSDKDIPIYEKYLDSLSNVGVLTKSKLKWYNYIIAEIDDNKVNDIIAFNFVDTVQQVKEHYISGRNTTEYNDCGILEYGNSFNHLNMLNIPDLHRYGFTGKGVRIGFLDSGYDWLKHQATKESNVVKTYDFIFRDSIVYNQEIDINGQDSHGSVVFSTVSAMDNGNYIGVAPNAEFYLAKTEDLRSETYYEMDLFAEAIIWMENNGVDIINASLGYSKLDTLPLTFDDLDGSYSIASRAINDASALGLICVIANGNNGDKPNSLNAPADADSAVAVGALNKDGETLVGFSSNGPNSKGVMKPNLVAQGTDIYAIRPSSEDKYSTTAGTSISSPLITGSFGLLKSVYNEIDSYTLKQNMFESADKYDNPDNRFGYGLPNIFKAVENLGVAISPENQLNNGNFKRLVFYIFPDKQILKTQIEVVYSDFKTKKYPLIKKNFDNQYYVDIPKQEFEGLIAKARVIVKSYNSYYFYPSSYNYFDILKDDELVQCGVNSKEIRPDKVFEPDNNFEIFPTITNNNGSFIISALLEDNYNIELEMTDIRGKIIESKSINFGPGILNTQLNVNNVISGAYFITFHYGGKVYHKKVIVIG